MNADIKTLVLKTLDMLPSRLGYWVYHQLQAHTTSPLESKIIANRRTAEKFQTVLEQEQVSVCGTTLLEIGSGWLPLMPYLLREQLQVARIHTYDLNAHYQNRYIDPLNALFSYDVRTDSPDGLHLPGFLHYHPRTNVVDTDLPREVSLVYSRFVLEHVTPGDLLAMHQRFSQVYGEETRYLHFISPGDHRAYQDKRLSLQDFLQYSSEEWGRIQTKFDYHNRLRLPQYLDVFTRAGLEVVSLDYSTLQPNSEPYIKFKALKLHSDYAGYTEEELTAGSIVVLLKKRSR